MKFITLLSLLSFIWVFYYVWYEDQERSIPGKLLWTFAALFFSIPTALVYFFSKRRR
ncbi:MAG: PLDc N-terminal domain-containing protein [Phaeodactylibacter sp.]|nr:PLDc N-terminal domain-containing protein [Phaeodactylibacter sp.]